MGDIQVRVMFNNYGEQKPLEGARVSIGFEGFFGGVSNSEYTDRGGYAHFDALDHWGSITVYVNGNDEGSYSCRGKADVTVTVDL